MQYGRAEIFERQYGAMLRRPPLSDITSARNLHRALQAKGIVVTEGVVKQWLLKYRTGDAAATGSGSIKSAIDLHEAYGAELQALPLEKKTRYLLCKTLRERDPPVIITDAVAKQWLSKYAGKDDLVQVNNAGQLETWYGARIRDELPDGAGADGGMLSGWLQTHLSVAAETRVCQKWLTTDYSSSGMLLSTAAVEESLGARLRLSQYRQSFLNEDALKQLADVLAESQPPVQVGTKVLRQWYVKYHPDSGPLRYATAEALNDALGDHMRAVYAELGYRRLRTVLAMRRKSCISY